MTASNDRPIVITMGDPSGVGPEVTVKALAALDARERRDFAVVGDRAVLARALAACGLDLPLVAPGGDGIAVIDVPVEGLPDRFGVLSPRCGEACFQYIRTAVEWAQAGRGRRHRHRADQQGGAELRRPPLRRPHRPARAPDRAEGVLDAARLRAAERHPRLDPRLAPHRDRPGEARAGARDDPHRPPAPSPHGHRGAADRGRRHQPALRRERPVRHRGRRVPRPGRRAARAEGIDVVGPISADTVYHRAYNGAFDLVVAQYHDQGHIPIKLVAFDTAVNVSLGLPIDRSSVDHGTAFDIAGTGKPNHVNMLSALSYARGLAKNPRQAVSA